MKAANAHIKPWSDYIPLFILTCFSGNPFFTSAGYSKSLLVLFTIVFVLFALYHLTAKEVNKTILQLVKVIAIIVILSIFQKYTLGLISYPGVLALILKITLGYFMLLYYKSREINPFHLYIKMISLLAKISIPFFLLNFFVHAGLQLETYNTKSLIIYTSFDLPKDLLRNAGMFWEPGAFAGYLILGFLFIVLQNQKFTIGTYKKESFWILVGLITSMSTTGILILGILLFLYIYQTYRIGRFVMIPLAIGAGVFAYNNLEFLNEKIEDQYTNAVEMESSDVSNTRFGSLNMDLQYITDQPFTGNGLDGRTRYRFHPWITEDIGHGNGMSNFLVYWGIPFLLFWIFCVYQFSYKLSESIGTSILVTFIILLVLQGEQFLNYPLFLLFFTAPAIQVFHHEIEDEEIPQLNLS